MNEYDNLSQQALDEEPNWRDYLEKSNFDTNFSNDRRFTDEYNTETTYTLRELLVLVWWLHNPKPRHQNIKFPKYFLNVYYVDAERVTVSLIKDTYIRINSDDDIVATQAGIELYNKFERLWEIHQDSNANLDLFFDDWNLVTYKIRNIQQNLEWTKAMVNYQNDKLKWMHKYSIQTAQTQMLKETVKGWQNNLKRLELDIKSLKDLR